MGQVRIIGGKYRSRIIHFSDKVTGLRPTLDYIRETLFNWLLQDVSNKKFLDLFAGSGALGFEALSRGAKSVDMVEQNLSVIKDLKANQAALKCDNLNILCGDGIKYLTKCKCDFDVLFLDPPYNSDLLDKCLKIIQQKRDELFNVLIYLECEKKSVLDLTNYTILKIKETATMRYMLIQLNA